jgi:hypothetical protein
MFVGGKRQKCVQNKPPGRKRSKFEDENKIDIRTVWGVRHEWN